MFLDEEGLEQLDELIKKETNRLKQAVSQKANAYQNDTNTWHDNSDFDNATEKENAAINEINKLIDIKINAEIIKKHMQADKIDVGDVVTVEIDEDVFDVILTGKYITNAGNGEITLNSPLGENIYKKSIGDIIKYKHLGNSFVVKIIDFKRRERGDEN